jgi:hypothetical protein
MGVLVSEHTLEEQAEALRALGFNVRRREEDRYHPVRLRLLDEDGTVGEWYPGIEMPSVEVAVRTAVLKVAPCSHALPRFNDLGERWVSVRLLDANGHRPRLPDGSLCKFNDYIPDYGGDYTQAWINAAVALHRAGLIPEDGA